MTSLSLKLGLSAQRPLAPSFVGPVDDYSALLTGAWSVVRRLLTSYDGPLVRLRRTSDSVESDFGALANGRLDESAVNSFLGGAGAVVKVYDQAAANDWTEASASVQPSWVSALSEFNGAPALYAGTSKGMICGMSLTLPYSILLTECNPSPLVNYSQRTLDSDGGNTNNRYICAARTNAGQAYDAGAIAPPVATAAAVCEILSAPSGGVYKFYSNAVEVSAGSLVNTNNWGQLRMGVRGVWSEVANSNVAEMATFNTNLSGVQVTALQVIFNPATL